MLQFDLTECDCSTLFSYQFMCCSAIAEGMSYATAGVREETVRYIYQR